MKILQNFEIKHKHKRSKKVRWWFAMNLCLDCRDYGIFISVFCYLFYILFANTHTHKYNEKEDDVVKKFYLFHENITSCWMNIYKINFGITFIFFSNQRKYLTVHVLIRIFVWIFNLKRDWFDFRHDSKT